MPIVIILVGLTGLGFYLIKSKTIKLKWKIILNNY
jgi:hypothetical protein